MLRSSLGFHTMTLSMALAHDEAQQLIGHFLEYRRNTGLIQIYQIDAKGNYYTYRPVLGDPSILPLHLKVRYLRENRGIKWNIFNHCSCPDYKSYFIEATINPKILSGVHDYITAAACDDMGAAIENFNSMAGTISPLLKNFDSYTINRLDYCLNLCVDELVTGCNADQIMELIRRGDIPSHFRELTEYDNTAHRMKRKPNCFYLINDSVNINCYNKYAQLSLKSQENTKKKHSPVDRITLDSAYGIIRFEVQCKYHKMYALSQKMKASGSHGQNTSLYLLSPVSCIDVVNKYYNKVIRRGDWYTLEHAVKKIRTQNFNKQKEKRLTNALQFVSQCRSLSKAKESFQGDDLKSFKKTLSDLSSLGINPVTIPKAWGISHIPNLLYAYHDKVSMEKWMNNY